MDVPIIDAHCHIFSDSIAPKAIKNVYNFYGRTEEIPKGMGTVGLLLELNRQLGVEKNVIAQVAMSPQMTKPMNQYLLKEFEKHPEVFIPFVSIHPDNEEILPTLQECKERGAKGVKLHPDSQRFQMDEERVNPIYEACAVLGLPILMHCGDKYLDNSHPKRLAQVVKRHPNTLIIAAHFGGYSKWEQAFTHLSDLRDAKNLYFDVSTSIPEMPRELVHRFFSHFGFNKFLYGSDYPISDAQKALEDFKDLGLSEEQERLILRENAIRILNL